MSPRTIAGMAAAVLVFIAAIPYVRSIVQGHTRPSSVSWGIWAALGLLLLASSWASGAAATLWFAGAYFVVPLAIFVLALTRGTPQFSPLDVCCLAGAVLGLIVWWTLQSAPIALYAFIGVDALGAIPTLRKSYRDPFSEALPAWLLGFGAATLNLAAVGSWTPQISAYPLYASVSTGLITLTLIVCRAAARTRTLEAAR